MYNRFRNIVIDSKIYNSCGKTAKRKVDVEMK